MTAPLQEVDLKTPTQPYPEPPPPYADYAQHPSAYPSAPPQQYSPHQQPYPAVGFHIQSPQTEYQPYPIGSGTYPGTGSYGHSNLPPNTAYVIRTSPACAAGADQCHIDRMHRRRRILFIVSIIISILCLSIALSIIFGN